MLKVFLAAHVTVQARKSSTWNPKRLIDIPSLCSSLPINSTSTKLYELQHAQPLEIPTLYCLKMLQTPQPYSDSVYRACQTVTRYACCWNGGGGGGYELSFAQRECSRRMRDCVPGLLLL